METTWGDGRGTGAAGIRRRSRLALLASCVGLALAANACGKAVSDDDDHTGTGGFSGDALTGGTQSASSGAPSVAGSSSSGGAVNTAGATDGENALAALDTDDATIDSRSGRELLELAIKIGYAEGYAQCTCLLPGPRPLDPAGLDGCARAESNFERLFEPATFRCVLEQSTTVSGFDDAVRCRAKKLRSRGRGYQRCTDGPGGPNLADEPSDACSEDDTATQLLVGNTCLGAILCNDGKFQQTGRCDLQLDCSDASDERGCRELFCGDQLIDALAVC